MVIERARQSDLDQIVQVQATAMVASSYYEQSNDVESEYERLHPRVHGYYSGTYQPSYALDERAIFVARENNKVVGFAAGHRSTRMECEAELQWMFVLPELQRQGIGGQLFTALRDWFIQNQWTKVIVDADPENPFRRFYVNHGAIALDEYWLYWPDIHLSE